MTSTSSLHFGRLAPSGNIGGEGRPHSRSFPAATKYADHKSKLRNRQWIEHQTGWRGKNSVRSHLAFAQTPDGVLRRHAAGSLVAAPIPHYTDRGL